LITLGGSVTRRWTAALLAAAVIAGVWLVALRITLPVADASSGGKIGFSGNPEQGGQSCDRCHSGGVEPDVAIDGPDQLMPGVTDSFTLTISGGQEAVGGFNVSATDGALMALLGATDVKAVDNELTHTSPKVAEPSGELAFRFLWTAPESDGVATLYGAGNSADGNASPSGDAVGLVIHEISVGEAVETPTATDEPTPETPEPTASPGTDEPTASPETPQPTGETPQPTDEMPTETPETEVAVYLPLGLAAAAIAP
jgi:hypothetical protein